MPSKAADTPGTWKLDADASRIGFRVMSLPPARGRFARAAGSLTVGEDGACELEATIPVAGMSTGLAMRDWHLRGREFLDAKTHPEIRFASSEVHRAGERLRIKGRLTIRGVTRVVELHGVLRPVDGQPDALSVLVAGELRRRDYRVGTAMYALMVAPRVKFRLELIARRA